MKYSIHDIDRMRWALDKILTPWNSGFYQHELDAKIEDQLRTYMLNGTSPEELSTKAQKIIEDRQKDAP